MSAAYLNSIRNDSRYPTFRGFVTIATFIGYAASLALAGIGIVSGSSATAFGLVAIAVLLSVVAKVAQEVSLMVADIADATIDNAAKASKAQLQSMHQGGVGDTYTAWSADAKNGPAANLIPITPDDVQACLVELAAIGCKVTKTGEGSWEIDQPSGVKAFAHSPSSLITVAARILRGADSSPKQ